MALDDLYVVDFTQTYNGEDMHSIFTYERSPDMTATDIVLAFIDDVVPAINSLQTSVVQNKLVKAYSLGSLDDIDERLVTGGGITTGVPTMPAHDALNYTFKPASRAVRPGSKRISGIPQTNQADGIITNGAYITQMETVRLVLDGGISEDEVDFAFPVIVKRVKYNPDPDEPDHWAYRFPEIGETPVYARFRTTLSNTKISHQVSRGN